MAITKSTDLSNSAVTNYQKAYYLIGAKTKEVFGQFVDWQDPIADDGGFGGTMDFPVYGSLEPIETALTEDADVTPESIADSNVTLTPYEYGRAVASTQVARFKSRTRLQTILGEMVARDRINSIDRIIRRTVTGRGSSLPTQRFYVTGATMLGQAHGNVVTLAFLEELAMHASAQGIEPMDGTHFVAVVHPLVYYDLQQISEFKALGQYAVPDITYRAEVGMLGGIRFVVSRQARIFQASGAVDHDATTINGALAAGATTVVVTDGTGMTAGEYLTLGTIESETVSPGANLETVLITNVSTHTLTVVGLSSTGYGLRYAHASGESALIADHVAPIPILGKNSLIGIHGARTGRYGQAITKGGLDILDRIMYLGWYWYGGVAAVERHRLCGYVGLSKKTLGYN